MATLDDEWLGGDDKPIEEQLRAITLADLAKGDRAMELYDMITHAAGTIRALRLLVELKGKRIDELESELEWRRDEELWS